MATGSTPRRACRAYSIRRACSAGLHPGLDQRTGDLLRAGRRAPAIAWRPGPADQRVLADVMDQLFYLAATIAYRVLDLRADLGERLSCPGHLARSDRPFRMARTSVGFQV